MAFIPVPNVAQVEIRGTLYGQRVENTFYYLNATDPTVGELQTLVNTLDDVVIEEWLGLLPSGWVGTEVYARSLTSAEGVEARSTGIAGEVGTGPAPGLPGNVTLAIKRSAGLTGRSTRGRIYWMGLVEDDVVGNTVDSGRAQLRVDAINLLDAAASAADWMPVIVSRYFEGAPRVSGTTYPIVLWSVTDYFVDSQRRRLTGRGL